jgi:peptidoglycan/LPS O-acetylase OafA/YrhL
MSKRPQQLQSIQALRGIAALIVVCFHSANSFRNHLPSDLSSEGYQREYQLMSGFWDRGFAGVDLFFVISGFIMMYVSFRKKPSFETCFIFLHARLIRVFPVWWLFASIISVYYFSAYGAPGDPDRAGMVGGPWKFFVQSMLLIPQNALPVLYTGWTLIHEIHFYVIFAILLLLPRKYVLPFLVPRERTGIA